MSMTDNPANLRQQARTIASGTKSARAAWSELKSWAAGKGPLAMKRAAEEFLTIHSRSPESAVLMPEVMHSAAWGMSPTQRHEMVAGQRFSPALGRPSPQIQPRSATEMLPLTMFFRPKQKNSAVQLGTVIPLDSSVDPVYLKDAEFRARGTSMTVLPKPVLSQAGQKPFDPSRSPDSFGRGVEAGEGSQLMKNLIQRMRAHGREEFTSSHSISIHDLPAPKPSAPKVAPAVARPKARRSTKARKRVFKLVKKAKPSKTRAKTKNPKRKTTKTLARLRTVRAAKTKRPVRMRNARKHIAKKALPGSKSRRTARKAKRSPR